MSVATLMALAALAASLVLVTQATARLFPIVALVASGLEVLLAFRVVSFSVSGINVLLVLAAALLVGGGVSWVQTESKTPVSAATVVVVIGAIQLAGALHLG